jgi:hypothetical protein
MCAVTWLVTLSAGTKVLKSSQEKLLNLLKPSGREDRKLEALK